jgi:hypothetical protein
LEFKKLLGRPWAAEVWKTDCSEVRNRPWSRPKNLLFLCRHIRQCGINH